MQETRQQILEILNHRGQATVREIVADLVQRRGDGITAVTVRHHLNQLQKRGLITTPEMRHKRKPGRPQHVYALTEQAHKHFPSNYRQLTSDLIEQIRQRLPQSQVNVIFDGIADDMAASAQIPDVSLPGRLEMVVEYLNTHGYDADWEKTDEGYVLHTRNCPYHDISQKDDTLCEMDMRLITSLVGRVPRRLSLVSCGEATCSYLFPDTI